MKKYAYCFGCDGKFGASDGIASARRSSYFDLAYDPDVSSEDLPAIKHFYTWNRKPLTTPLFGTALFFVYWDTVRNTTIRETINVGSSDCDYLWI